MMDISCRLPDELVQYILKTCVKESCMSLRDCQTQDPVYLSLILSSVPVSTLVISAFSLLSHGFVRSSTCHLCLIFFFFPGLSRHLGSMLWLFVFFSMLPCLLYCPLSAPPLVYLSYKHLFTLGLANLLFSLVCPHLAFFSLCEPI